MAVLSVHPARQIYSPVAPRSIRFPLMHQRWLNLSFIHWQYKPEVVQRVLPAGLAVETYQGAAWVGLVPFMITNLRPFSKRVPGVLASFQETNLRTYVRGPDGDTGVWFFSLEAKSLAAVIGARLIYNLPYMWARMSVEGSSNKVWYRSRRRWPHSAARSDIEVRVGAQIPAGFLTEFDHFLTARFSLYTRLFGRWAKVQIEHSPWPLSYAKVKVLDQTLLAAAGLPEPNDRPVVRFCDRLDVKIGRPQFVD